jgi:hypothetical protein
MHHRGVARIARACGQHRPGDASPSDGDALPAASACRASPATPSTIGRAAAIASNIFDGSTVVNTSDGRSVTNLMSLAARSDGTAARGTRPVNVTLQPATSGAHADRSARAVSGDQQSDLRRSA